MAAALPEGNGVVEAIVDGIFGVAVEDAGGRGWGGCAGVEEVVANGVAAGVAGVPLPLLRNEEKALILENFVVTQQLEGKKRPCLVC
jgi:hypothetical protein